MVDVRSKNITGDEAAVLLDHVRITVNKNLIPFDPQPPKIASGIRIGTPAVTTRGMKEREMEKIAELINQAVVNKNNPSVLSQIKADVEQLAGQFPIYQDLN